MAIPIAEPLVVELTLLRSPVAGIQTPNLLLVGRTLQPTTKQARSKLDLIFLFVFIRLI